MEIASILREIDVEIERLQRIREIVDGLSWSPPKVAVKPNPKAEVLRQASQEPNLIVDPPRAKRVCARRPKPAREEVRALAPAPFDRPVFVPREALTLAGTEMKRPVFDSDSLEAAVRKNLMRGAAFTPVKAERQLL